MIPYKIFFQLIVTVLKENVNLSLPLVTFVFETVFVLEQIA